MDLPNEGEEMVSGAVVVDCFYLIVTKKKQVIRFRIMRLYRS